MIDEKEDKDDLYINKDSGIDDEFDFVDAYSNDDDVLDDQPLTVLLLASGAAVAS